MNKSIPNLRGLIDPRIADEIHRAFTDLYRYVDEELSNIKIDNPDIDTRIIRQLNLFTSRLATPLIEPSGNDLATVQQERTLSPTDIPNLDAAKIITGTFPLARLATSIVKTDDAFTITVGAIPVGGKITLKDNNGHTVDVLTA